MLVLNKYRVLWIALVLSIAVLFLFPYKSMAESPTTILDPNNNTEQVEDKDVTDSVVHEEKAGVELDIKKWDLSHYVAISDMEDKWFFEVLDKTTIQSMNSLINTIFSMTKLVAEGIDDGISYLYSIDVINLLCDKVSTISSMLWDNIYKSFGVLFFLIAIYHICYVYFGKMNSQQALKMSLGLFFALGLSVLWFSQASWNMKVLNNLSNEVQGIVMKSGTSFIDESDHVQKGQELDGSLAIMRNVYFDLIVKRPYLMMNYGTANEKKILEKDSNRIDKLLSYKMSGDGIKAKNEYVHNTEVEDYKNNNMSPSNMGYQLGIAVVSLVFSILLGIPLLYIALLNLVAGLAALIISLFMPVSVLISIIPAFQTSGINTFMKLVSVFVMKALVSLVILFMFWLIETIMFLIPPLNKGMYLVSTIVVIGSLFAIYKYRNGLIKLITSGRVVSLDKNIPEKSGNYLKMQLNKMRGKEESDFIDRRKIEVNSNLNRDDVMLSRQNLNGSDVSKSEDVRGIDLNKKQGDSNQNLNENFGLVRSKQILGSLSEESSSENLISMDNYLKSRNVRIPQKMNKEVNLNKQGDLKENVRFSQNDYKKNENVNGRSNEERVQSRVRQYSDNGVRENSREVDYVYEKNDISY